MKKIIIIAAALILPVLAAGAMAMENPEQRVTDTICNYIIKMYPDWPKDGIKLTYKMMDGVFADMKALPEAATFEVIDVYPEYKPVGSVVLPLQASYGETSQKYLVRARVEVFRKIAAASRLIKKGELIDSDAIKFDDRDVGLLPQKYFIEPDQLVSKEAKIAIPENSTIFEWMIGEVPLVHRGDDVTLVVSAPGLAVKTKAQAQEDGPIGAEIRVKRIDNNKIITGKIVSADEVEVTLQ